MVLSSSARSSLRREKSRPINRSQDDIGVWNSRGRGLVAHSIKVDQNEEWLIGEACRIDGIMSKAPKHRTSHTINYNVEQKYLPVNCRGSKECRVVARREREREFQLW